MSAKISQFSPLNCQELWNPGLIRKYDLSGPRYTSYPTAAQFQENHSISNWERAVAMGNQELSPLSLYFHIPFCETVCYYCACNKIITADKKKASHYLQYLFKEIAMQASYVDEQRPVTQLHWGGGTPTYISDDEMIQLMETTREHFNLLNDDSGEYSIEIHPAGVTPARISLLRKLGFNRLSMGIQDFDPAVQKAVNRFNSEEEVSELVKASREEGFKSISMDLIYGLPKQNKETFAKTLDKVIELSPDRLSLFNYAHMPHLFKVQKQINVAELPEPQEKLTILHNSIETLLNAGYEYIGMDHFAKPDDELAIAQHNGTLHRNFQGYATHSACDLLAFGVSSINSIGNAFFQNHKNIDDYIADVESNQLPVSRVIQLNDDDKIRQTVINEIICNFKLHFQSIEQQFGIRFEDYFHQELVRLKPLHDDGLIEIHEQSLEVKAAGRLLVRRICMEFDAYIDHEKQQSANNRYSRII